MSINESRAAKPAASHNSSGPDAGRNGEKETPGSDAQTDAVELEPGSRTARLYEVLAVDLWWSLGMMGAAGVIATLLFVATSLGPLRVAGIAVGVGTALVYAGRLIWLRGLSETQLDEWGVVLAEATAVIVLTEATAAILRHFGGGLL